MSIKNKIAQLKESMSNDLHISVIAMDATKAQSKTGHSYIMLKCQYKNLDNDVDGLYQAAHFSAAGELLAWLEEGKRYKVTTTISERGYDEWVSVVELPKDFVITPSTAAKRLVALDPLDASDAEDETEFESDFVL